MNKTDSMRASVICCLIIGNINLGSSQPLDYRMIFGSDWENAVTFVEENRSWIEPRLEEYDISFSLAIAVVFPELVRYSSLRDRMEITLCKSLYIHKGEKYADFSIGVFQMKPSFAEFIRENAPVIMGRRSKNLFKDKREYPDGKSYRASVIADLEKPETELNYLIAFLKICESRFRISRRDMETRLKFMATAYNYGIDKEQKQIELMINKKYFNTKLFQTENYSYSDVALFWFNQYAGEIINSRSGKLKN